MLTALIWLPLLMQAPGTVPSLVTRAFWETLEDTAPQYAGGGIKFQPILRVYFQTASLLPAGAEVSLQVNYGDAPASESCRVAPDEIGSPIDGWYAVQCVLRRGRGRPIADVSVQPVLPRSPATRLTVSTAARGAASRLWTDDEVKAVFLAGEELARAALLSPATKVP